jgi:CheY-like chemotaxis protein
MAAGRRRVLVIDDDAEGRLALGELLAMWGYETDEAHDGTRAIEVSREKRPDIVVLDLGLPDRNGVELIARLKAGGASVIAYSGWHNLEGGARAAGADAFVLKPDISALRRALAEADVTRTGGAPARNKSNDGR